MQQNLFLYCCRYKILNPTLTPQNSWEPWKLWEESLSDYMVIYLWLPYEGNNSSCILGARGLIQIKAFENKTHAQWKSWKLKNNESFTIQKSVACAVLEAKYGSRSKSLESRTAKRKQRNIWIIKRRQWKCQEHFDPSQIQNTFPSIPFLKNRTLHFKRQLPPWFPANNVCNFRQYTSSIIHLY